MSKIIKAVNADEARILEEFRKLNSEKQAIVLERIRKLVNCQEYGTTIEDVPERTPIECRVKTQNEI